MEKIILNIQERLKNVPEFKYIDEDSGQLDYYSARPPVSWPVCLIDLTGATYTFVGQDRSASPQERQMGVGNITITIANMKLSNTSGRAPLAMKQKAWSIWQLIESAHVQLQGFRPADNCGKLVRNSFKRVMRDDGVQEYKITYTMSLDNV